MDKFWKWLDKQPLLIVAGLYICFVIIYLFVFGVFGAVILAFIDFYLILPEAPEGCLSCGLVFIILFAPLIKSFFTKSDYNPFEDWDDYR